MNTKTLAKIHKFGKIGTIAMTVLMVITILASILMCVTTIFVSTLLKDAVTVSVTNQAELRISDKNFDTLWDILCDSFAYATNQDPEAKFSDENAMITPPENQKLETNLEFFNQTYSSAEIRTDGNIKVIYAQSSPVIYRSGNLATILIFLTLLVASIAVALFMIRKMFAVISTCNSPFCGELVKKMKAFAFSLLPIALFGTIGETLSTAFLSAGQDRGARFQWGILIAFAVTMCLITVFNYGVQLQRESDETL